MDSKFCDWLVEKKGMSQRSAKDVVSRLRRVSLILNKKEGKTISIDELNSATAFQECSMFIKSQLRRAVTLFTEFSTE